MNESNFQKLYQSNFEITPRDRKLHEFAKRYHENCEAYDRTVCTGGIGPGGGIMPATSRERMLISRYAREMTNQLESEAADDGISRQELVRAIQRYDG